MGDQSRPVTGYPHPQFATNPNGQPTTGTAYPYAAPPPQSTHYNPNPYYGDPRAAQRATLFRRILAVILASVIITGTIILILWLVLRPRIPQFRVDSVTLSNFNISPSTSLISGNWDVRFTVRNPNHKITLAYYHIDAFMLYRSELLSETSLPPFVQGKKNETSVRANFAASSAYVNWWVVDGVTGDRARGSVSFNVRMVARVRFKAGAWRARRRLIRVFCGDLSVGVSSNGSGGSMVGGPRDCRVAL